MDCTRFDQTRVCTVIGSEGSLRWDGIAGVVEHFCLQKKEWVKVFVEPTESDDSYRAEWQYFIHCIETNFFGLENLNNAQNILKILGAANESNLYGKRIMVTKPCSKKRKEGIK